jgi:hypothetical protein
MPENREKYIDRLLHTVTQWYIFPAMSAIFILIFSCKKNFSSSQFIDDKLVVLAEISAPDSVKIPVGKTIKVGNGGIISFEKVNDATVVITEGQSTNWILQPNYSTQYASNPTTLFTGKQRFKYNTSYSIEIKHPTLGTVKATARIPALPAAIVIDTMANDTLLQGKEVLAASISWQDAAGESNYYVIEAVKEIVTLRNYFFYRGVRYYNDNASGKALYDKVKNDPDVRLRTDTVPQNEFIRLNVYTQDVNTQNAGIDDLSNPFRRIFITDDSFNGQYYTTKVFVDREFFTTTNPAQKGRVRLRFKSVNKDFYDYLLIYEKYKTDFGILPASQLISPSGNIQNGLGIFGASARRERIFYFDQF